LHLLLFSVLLSHPALPSPNMAAVAVTVAVAVVALMAVVDPMAAVAFMVVGPMAAEAFAAAKVDFAVPRAGLAEAITGAAAELNLAAV
jgi:hypothetical protein